MVTGATHAITDSGLESLRDDRSGKFHAQECQIKYLKRYRRERAQDQDRPQGKPFSLHG